MSKKVTAGADLLGDFAPSFAKYNDEILFGEIWEDESLDLKTRSIITMSALITKGAFEQLKFHIEKGKANGVTKKEISAMITQLGFYVGWPNAWSAFNIAKVVYNNDSNDEFNPLFGLGEFNKDYAQYFIGDSHLAFLAMQEGVGVFNVTFEPGCRNNWHIHEDGFQILLCTDGEGWYQEEGSDVQKLKKGDVVSISEGVKHWHGATNSSWFTHVGIGKGPTKWLEEVSDEQYPK